MSPVLGVLARMLLLPVDAAVSGSYGETWCSAVVAMFIICLTFSMAMFPVAFIIRAIMKNKMVVLIP